MFELYRLRNRGETALEFECIDEVLDRLTFVVLERWHSVRRLEYRIVEFE